MGTRMLIDASHPEESRVAIVSNDRLDEFDFEKPSTRDSKWQTWEVSCVVERAIHAIHLEIPVSKYPSLNTGQAA